MSELLTYRERTAPRGSTAAENVECWLEHADYDPYRSHAIGTALVIQCNPFQSEFVSSCAHPFGSFVVHLDTVSDRDRSSHNGRQRAMESIDQRFPHFRTTNIPGGVAK
jgi:hypothetical protein